MQFQDLNICLEEVSSKGEGCLEEHPTHSTHVQWVGVARAILYVFVVFDFILISRHRQCYHLADVSRSFCVHATLRVGLSKDPNKRIKGENLSENLM